MIEQEDQRNNEVKEDTRVEKTIEQRRGEGEIRGETREKERLET